MNTITVASILDRSSVLLHDVGYVRWSKDNRIAWINEAQLVIASNPEWKGASDKVQSILLTAGETRHELPSGALRLNEITRNMGTNGTTPGLAIRRAEKTDLDRDQPDWHMKDAVGYIKNFALDPSEHTRFFTYPKSPATAHYVEASFSFAPAAAVDGGVLQVDDAFADKVLNYMLSRCFAADTEAGSFERAAAYHALYKG